MRVMDKTMQALATAINMRQLKQEVLSSNVANAETPGYKAKRVEFEEALSRALDTDGQANLTATDPNHYNVGSGSFENLEPEIYEDPNGVVKNDGNTVDRDEEMMKINENKIMHDAAVQLINKKFALQKYIVNNER